MSKRLYCAWMSNRTDHRDDEAIKIRASSLEEAREIARGYQSHRFSVRNVYTLGDFKKFTGWPHTWAQPFNYERPKRKKVAKKKAKK